MSSQIDIEVRYNTALRRPVIDQLKRTPDDPTGYIARHNKAWSLLTCQGFEGALVFGIRSLAAYAAAHEVRYSSKLADDGVLGPAWADALRGFRALLNGELGRLDGGFLDGALCNLYREAGFEGEL
jgi:hypothetical protein